MLGFKKDQQFFKFCSYGFLKNLRFYEPFLLAFLLYKLPDDYSKVGMLYSLRFIIRFLLEIPSGIIADAWGRKSSLVLSYAFYIICFLSYYLADNFLQLLIPSMFFGIADAFRTGSHKAMILEYLSQKSWLEYRTKYYGLTRSWSQLGSAASSLIAFGFFLYKPEYDFIFLITIVPYILGLINIISYPNSLDSQRETPGKKQIKEIKTKFDNAVVLVKSKDNLRKLFGCSLFFGYHHALKDYFQIAILSLGINHFFQTNHNHDSGAIMLPAFYFITYLITSFSSRKANLLTKVFTKPEDIITKTLQLGVIFGGLAGLFLLLDIPAISVLAFIGVYIIINIQRPSVVSYISDHFPNNNMATILSIESQSGSLTASIIALIMGFLSDLCSVEVALIILSMILFIISLTILLPKNENNQ